MLKPAIEPRHTQEIDIMKTLIGLTLAISAIAAPALSFAQSAEAPITRAQVRAELVRLEQAGYSPSASDDANYPADIQAAEAKVAAQDAQRVAANPANDSTGSNATATTSVGAVASGSSESGMRAPVRGTTPTPGCTGPASYCSVYFGS
jgi:hypothetical protein